MSYFSKHIFFCLNDRGKDETCCNNYGATELQKYAKDRLRELGPYVTSSIRINRAGCLSRCDEGPVMVIYPEGVWYQYIDRSDIDEIIEKHIVGNEVVTRLLI
ncbi:MAG: 2Fe-2S ferredoxin [Betaproteobacteria bacterium TMED156]|nr:MAG: 2Fe-2S ferredoxin [Betaproteobacteria bacterium TMED156]|tara:strand:- start:4464 stop:4772 length:309 start_codon:yes stop_codon:yes gene_type:complete